MHGQFSWYDLMTPDQSASTKFYRNVAGWDTEDWKGAYTMWTTKGAPFAGMNPITPEQTAQGIPPHWIAYVTVDDVGKSAEQAASLGGRVLHGPEDIPEVGRFAIISDPQGAIIAIFKSENPTPGFDGNAELGKFSWHELMAVDSRAAFEFYSQMFGWEKTGTMPMPGGESYLMYGQKGKSFGGIFNRRAEHGNMPPNWTFYVTVADAKKAIAAAQRSGGSVVMPLMDVPTGQVAILKDSLGAIFAVFEKSPGAVARAATKVKKAAGKAAKKVAKAVKRAAAKKPKKSAKKKGAKKKTARKPARARSAARRKSRRRARGRR